MPTRIALRETAPSQVTPRFRRKGAFGTGLSSSEEDAIEEAAAAVTPPRDNSHSISSSNNQDRIGSPSANRASKRSIMGFRSSILRELSVRTDDPDADSDEEKVRVSSEDIRASPRLLGYMFCMIAASVMLVSVIQFKHKDIISVSDVDIKYFQTANGLVYRWKLWGAIYIAAIGVGSCALTVLVHFETVCFPHYWVKVFRDGSLAERNLIRGMILFWAAGVHICTSSLSVGETQANVFFTTWIAFGSIALNYGVWRESAGFTALAEKINLHHRETTYNWLWTGLFSCIFAGAATDIFYNRQDLELRFRGEKLNLDDRDWSFILSSVWAEVAICVVAVCFNEWFLSPQSSQCPCVSRRESGIFRCVFGWRQLEGLVILASMAGKFYVILEYTGVDGVVQGLSNAYFGVWGSFFNSVFLFGTWLKENKNIDYFVRESNDEESAEP